MAAGGVLFNTFVHVLMYWYYFVCTVPWLKAPWWKKYLTTLQILQFVVSLVMAVFFVMAHQSSLAAGHAGCTGWNAFLASTAFNFTLLGLFMQFYASTYKGW